MKTKEKLQIMKNSKTIPFHVCESGLYCVGGEVIPPYYFKTIDGAYNKFQRLLIKNILKSL